MSVFILFHLAYVYETKRVVNVFDSLDLADKWLIENEPQVKEWKRLSAEEKDEIVGEIAYGNERLEQWFVIEEWPLISST